MSYLTRGPILMGIGSQASGFGRRPMDVSCLPKQFGGATVSQRVLSRADKSHLLTTGSR